jgi:hypothetical protein
MYHMHLKNTHWFNVVILKGKYCEEYMAQYKREDAGVPDGTMNPTPYITI